MQETVANTSRPLPLFAPGVVPGAVVNGSPGCKRCEMLPALVNGPGTLHMQFPLSHSRSKILTYLHNTDFEYSQENDTVSIGVPGHNVASVVAPLVDVLSSTEQADVRVLFQEQGREMRLPDYFEIESLQGFLARNQSGWLCEMMEQDRLTAWFQPIVECRAPERVFAYECLMRGTSSENEIVFPTRILEAARGAGLLFQLDRAARLTAIRQAARFGLQSHIFINFTPTSIYDPVNCLRSTVQAVDEMGLHRGQVVFEVIESEFVRDMDHLKGILDYYRASGFKVALDDVGAGYSNLNLLRHLRPDFIKIDRDLTTDVHRDDYKGLIMQKLLEIAQGLGLRTIAEGIEHEDEFDWLRAHGADYAQGYFFARPATPPPMLEGQIIAAR